MRRLYPALGLVALCLVITACARRQGPPGGPKDVTPPEVLSWAPAADAVNVPRDTVITLTFSEKIDQRSLDQSLWIAPRSLVPKIEIKGFEAGLAMREPLPESTTVTVLISTHLSDRRKNPLATPVQWSFSTGPTLAPGRVSGKIDAKSQSGYVLVGLYPVEADTLPDFQTTQPEYLTQAEPGGEFVLQGLEADGRLWMAVSMLDKNGNFESAGREEFVSAFAESVRLTPQNPTRELDLRLVDPEAPGGIEGIFTGVDSLGVLGLEVYTGNDTTLSFAVARAQVDTSGAFNIQRLDPGFYRLIAYCDNNDNGYRDLFEPPVILFSRMRVRPGSPTTVAELAAPQCSPADSSVGR